MNIEKIITYYLREGLIDIRYGEKNFLDGKQRVQIRLHNNPFKIIKINDETGNFKNAITDPKTGSILIINSEIIKEYGTPMEIFEGVDVNDVLNGIE